VIQHLQANGIQVAYRFGGPEDAPVVVLSNSLMPSHTMWEPTRPALTRRYRTSQQAVTG
jgi:3-oxoadipate enol-lactonase